MCSLYIPLHDPINEKELNILQQQPTPYLLLGDFNRYYSISVLKTTNQPKKQNTENIISNNNLCLFNSKSQTHLDPSSATYAALDLTLSDPSIFLDFSRNVYGDTCRSDHFFNCDLLHPLSRRRPSSMEIEQRLLGRVQSSMP